MNSKLEQDLKDLYHSNHHKDIQPRFYNSVKVGQEERNKKIKNFEKKVEERHRPKIDPIKQQKIKEQILDLELKESKGKRKVKQ